MDLKLIIVLLLIALFPSVEANAQNVEWNPIRSEACGFSVQVPGEVNTRSDTTQVGPGLFSIKHSYTAPGYSAYCLIYPAQLFAQANETLLIEMWLQFFAKSIDIELEEVSEWGLNQYPGRAFRGKDALNPDDPFYYVEGRVIKANSHFIMLLTTRKNREAEELEDTRFFDSLKLD